jgi:hypothetical protein
VELASGRLRIPGSKTAAAADRTVDILPLLRDELAALAAARNGRELEALVFATSTGNRQGESNLRRRVLASAAERANVPLAKHGIRARSRAA